MSRVARALVLLLAASGSFWAPPAGAASLTVESAAAFSGDFGLRVTPGCGYPFSVELSTPPVAALPDEVTACTKIVAAGVEIVSPGSLFRAGEGIEIGELFAVDGGAEFTAVLDVSLLPWAWVEDLSPVSEIRYSASFYLDIEEMTLEPGDRLEHFVGFSAAGIPWLRVVLARNSLLGENRLTLEARLDDGGWVSTSDFQNELLLEGGWNEIRLDWGAAAAGGDDGWFMVEVRNVRTGREVVAELSCSLSPGACLANSRGRIDSIQWGAVGGVLEASTGSLKLDRFVSWK
jgi:hypothetical protein